MAARSEPWDAGTTSEMGGPGRKQVILRRGVKDSLWLRAVPGQPLTGSTARTARWPRIKAPVSSGLGLPCVIFNKSKSFLNYKTGTEIRVSASQACYVKGSSA